MSTPSPRGTAQATQALQTGQGHRWLLLQCVTSRGIQEVPPIAAHVTQPRRPTSNASTPRDAHDEGEPQIHSGPAREGSQPVDNRVTKAGATSEASPVPPEPHALLTPARSSYPGGLAVRRLTLKSALSVLLLVPTAGVISLGPLGWGHVGNPRRITHGNLTCVMDIPPPTTVVQGGRRTQRARLAQA